MTEEKKALNWWNNLNQKTRELLYVSFTGSEYTNLNDFSLSIYNWIKSITPKE